MDEATRLHWKFCQDDQGYHWELTYEIMWSLRVHYDASAGRWKGVARAEGAADGYREEWVDAGEGDPDPAMVRAREMADDWVQNV